MQLTSSQRALINDILMPYLTAENKVYLFGSRAKNSAKPFSDVDICITGTPLSLMALAQLKDDFSESDLPYFVDVVQKERISHEFWELVKQDMIDLSS